MLLGELPKKKEWQLYGEVPLQIVVEQCLWMLVTYRLTIIGMLATYDEAKE